MREIKLFEIPLYSMKENEYIKRCYKYIDDKSSMTTPDNYEFFHEYMENTYYKKRPWKYNQIVGYITISFKDNSIWFDEYCTFDKRIHVIADRKHIIYNMMLNGHHFYLKSDMNNNEIKDEILNWIKGIEKNIINKPLYLDKELFLLQLKSTDIREMIGSDK